VFDDKKRYYPKKCVNSKKYYLCKKNKNNKKDKTMELTHFGG
jgi:hypothetical protein